MKRGTPRPKPEAQRRRRQTSLVEEAYDPYAVTPEDALDAARREVKRWRLDQLARKQARGELDPVTSFFVLAWDSFRAPVFPYDEALRLARAVGLDLDRDVVGVLGEKAGSDLRLWDSARRAAKSALGAPDGSRAMLDALHHAAHTARTKTLAVAKEALEKRGLLAVPAFLQARTRLTRRSTRACPRFWPASPKQHSAVQPEARSRSRFQRKLRAATSGSFQGTHALVYPDDGGQRDLMEAVYADDGIKSGRNTPEILQRLQAVCAGLIAKGCEIITPGFTELSLVHAGLAAAVSVPLINVNACYADFSLYQPAERPRKPFKVGVGGGVGPLATVDFMGRVVRLTKAGRDQDHIKMIVEQNPQIPDRTEHLVQSGTDPMTEIIQDSDSSSAPQAN